MDLIIGAPIDERSPVAGNNAPKRRLSFTPPPPEPVVVVAVEFVVGLLLFVVGGVLG